MEEAPNREADSLSLWGSPDYDQEEIVWTVSNRLRDETSEGYDRIAALVKTFNPMANRDDFLSCLSFQLDFHCHTEPLYAEPVIQQMSLGLPHTGRAVTIRLEMEDLGMTEVANPVSSFSLPGGLIQRLGWLYVAESLYRGFALALPAAHKLKISENVGEWHLAKHVDGSAQQWQTFTAKLDKLHISDIEAERLYSGARSAVSFAYKQMNASRVANSQSAS